MTRPLNRFLSLAALALVTAAPVRGQDDDDTRFNQSQAKELNEFAANAFKRGFPRRARLIWLQAIKLYDPDSAAAHEALGHTKVGDSWAPRSDFEYPTEDTGTSRDGQVLRNAYEKLKTTLARGHKRQAQQWERAGRVDKSRYHWEMVVRWDKDDKDAQEALGHQPVGGVTGTDLEKTLYDRSKAIEHAVAEQAAIEYPVEQIERKAAVLDRAQVPYVTVQSEHFVLHGDTEQLPQLQEALMWAERALRVMEVAFPWKVEMRGEWAFFSSKDTYKQVLKANADQVQNLEWRLEHTSTSGIGNLLIAATSSTQLMFDAAVRNVARGYSQMQTDGFSEGIGHTFVGMMFNQNRLFSVDLEKQQGTVATEEDRAYQSPDFDVWKTLALEMAWKLTGGVPAIAIPFADAAKFSNEERIKAWSFTDYMVRRDPELLRKLDQLGAQQKQTGVRRPNDLAAKFEAEAGVSVAQLDKEWEDFWTEATPVLQAIRDNTPPLSAISPGVEKWLKAFNAARAKLGATPVTWSIDLSARCKEHAEYLKQNKNERGPVAEHRQLPDLGGSHLGSMFAQMAIVEIGARANKAGDLFEQWLKIPGYRDALVHDFLRSVGIYTEGDILVMNVVSGLGRPASKSSGYLTHPKIYAKGIPRSAEVAPIGPELEKLLEEHGQGGKKTIGYPLTLHFGSSLQGDPLSYRCNAVGPRGRLEGAILRGSGKIRRSSAPGMVTFYPFEELPSGKIRVTWSWEVDGEPKTYVTEFETK